MQNEFGHALESRKRVRANRFVGGSPLFSLFGFGDLTATRPFSILSRLLAAKSWGPKASLDCIERFMAGKTESEGWHPVAFLFVLKYSWRWQPLSHSKLQLFKVKSHWPNLRPHTLRPGRASQPGADAGPAACGPAAGPAFAPAASGARAGGEPAPGRRGSGVSEGVAFRLGRARMLFFGCDPQRTRVGKHRVPGLACTQASQTSLWRSVVYTSWHSNREGSVVCFWLGGIQTSRSCKQSRAERANGSRCKQATSKHMQATQRVTKQTRIGSVL